MLNYLGNVAVAFDQLINAICGGSCDESISAHAYRLWVRERPLGWLKPVIDALFFWQKAPGGHCQRAYDRERARYYLPKEYR